MNYCQRMWNYYLQATAAKLYCITKVNRKCRKLIDTQDCYTVIHCDSTGGTTVCEVLVVLVVMFIT